MNDKIIRTLRYVVTLLVKEQYEELEKLTMGIRLQANHIKSAIQEYGRTLIMPPDSTYDKLDIIEIEGVKPVKWSVTFDLWTMEEGRSDLSLELTLINSDSELLGVELDNIHVL